MNTEKTSYDKKLHFLVTLANQNDATIMCKDTLSSVNIFRYAERIGIDILPPLTWQWLREFIHEDVDSKPSGKRYSKNIIIDDYDVYGDALFNPSIEAIHNAGMVIVGISLSDNVLTDIKSHIKQKDSLDNTIGDALCRDLLDFLNNIYDRSAPGKPAECLNRQDNQKTMHLIYSLKNKKNKNNDIIEFKKSIRKQ